MNDLMELVRGCPVVVHRNEKAEGALLQANRLRDLGFTALAKSLLEKARVESKLNVLAEKKYIKIPNGNILAYLEARVKSYNEEHQKEHKKERRGASAIRYVTDYTTSPHWSNVASTTVPYVWPDRNTTGIYAQALSYMLQRSETLPEAHLRVPTIHAMANDPETIGYFEWTETRVEDYRDMPPDSVLSTLGAEKEKGLFDFYTIGKVNAVHDPLLLGRIVGCPDRFFLYQWGDDISLDDLI